ncbi:LOW QUALITY PROTEIN: hypothetical protein OSB04_022183 [Centaurea solstitialis]|uniref:Uncharacterized protein n=1 Tax=Centaurea solstitialis TaxID=347529 RepID=A0AA38T7N1_9ASTR|nr:LOW QUALITY PROTEIN: hypothetical protein OSB04_022183 [Centaurea solstitialis]
MREEFDTDAKSHRNKSPCNMIPVTRSDHPVVEAHLVALLNNVKRYQEEMRDEELSTTNLLIEECLLVVDSQKKYEALLKYDYNLTEPARIAGPVIGRDDEIRKCIHILSRRTKNNLVIVGESGVGKTAIAEGPKMFLVVQCLGWTVERERQRNRGKFKCEPLFHYEREDSRERATWQSKKHTIMSYAYCIKIDKLDNQDLEGTRLQEAAERNLVDFQKRSRKALLRLEATDLHVTDTVSKWMGIPVSDLQLRRIDSHCWRTIYTRE